MQPNPIQIITIAIINIRMFSDIDRRIIAKKERTPLIINVCSFPILSDTQPNMIRPMKFATAMIETIIAATHGVKLISSTPIVDAWPISDTPGTAPKRKEVKTNLKFLSFIIDFHELLYRLSVSVII